MSKKVKNIYLLFSAILILGIAAVIIYNKYFSLSPRDREITKLHEKYFYLNLDKDVAYTGDVKCKSCHSGIHESFHKSGMGNSLFRPSPENEIENYSNENIVYNPNSDYYYQTYKKGNEYFQKEFRKDKDGKVIHELERKVDYVIGSGNNTRSYLYSENGFYYEMPVSWFTEKAKWDMSPGYEKTNLRFSRPIVQECMNCHNSASGFVEFSENKFDAHLKEGISCESCHGPGELHIMRQTQKNNLFESIDKDTIDRTIVNPANLPLDEKLSVCFQCHLQGEVRVFTEDKEQTDYKPGMKLSDIKTVFVQDNVAEGDFKIASHAARMVMSKCFINSNGGLTCLTCHDPHIPVQEVSKDFFNSKCLDCHKVQQLSPSKTNADHSENGNCISCHMKQGATKDVQHVNFTDHWIRKEINVLSKDEQDKLFETNSPITLKNFNNADDKYAGINLGIAYVIYYDSRHSHPDYLKIAIPALEENLKKFPDHKTGLYYLGYAYLKSNRLQDAVNTFQKLVTIDPGNALAYFQLGTAFEKSKNYLKAIETYLTSLNIFPDNIKALNSIANLYYNSGKVNEAINAYNKALNLNSNATNVLNNLADINLYRLKNISEAKVYLLRAVDADPDFIPALNNLGNAFMLEGNSAEAEGIFNRILTKDPKNILALGNLAVINEDRGDIASARKLIRKVLEIDPNDSRAKQMLDKLGN